MQHKILVICQDQQLLPEIKSSLEQTDCEIHCAVNYQQAVDRISRFHYIMVIMDLDFSEASGIEVLRRLPPDKVSTSAYITGFTREYSSGADIPRRLLNVYLSSPPSFIALMSESILFNCFTSFFVLRSLQSRMVGSSSFSQSSVYNLNTEGCTKREITVQGHPAELYVTGEEMLQKRFSMTGFDIWSDMMIYWIDENNRVIVQINATNLTEEEMLRLAEGFHWGGGQ